MSLRLKSSIVALFLLASMGCAGRNPITIERPNARTPLEERSYNLLKTADTILTTAAECDTNLEDGCEVADFMRPVLSALETAYNEALAASLIYVAFLDAGSLATADSEQNLEDLIFSIDRLITRVIAGGGE